MSPPEPPPAAIDDDDEEIPPSTPSPPPSASSAGYAVELYFDPALENQVLRHWNALSRRGLSIHLLSIRARPHLPLLALPLSVDPLRLAPALRALAARHYPIPISFSSVASFSSPDTLLFLSPTPNAALLGLHAQLCELVKKEGVEPTDGFRPDGWVPRCAVASDVPRGRMGEAYGVVREFRLPVAGYGVDIGLVEFPPVKEMFSFPLGGATGDN